MRRSHLLRCQAVSLWRHHVVKGIVNLWSGLNFQLGFLLGILFIPLFLPNVSPSLTMCPSEMISQTLSSNLAAHFDECFLVLGQLLSENAIAQHMMIIVSQLDILKCLQTFDMAAFGFKPLDVIF